MARTTLVYLHGFNSSPDGAKSSIIAAAIGQLADPPRLWRPQLDHRPAKAVGDVGDWIARNARDIATLTLVGSSLGGFYAIGLAERFGARAVLINPAIHPERSLAAYAGLQVNPYTGETYELDEEHFGQLRALAVDRITRPDRYLLLQRSGDELLDWREAVEYCAGAWQHVIGGGDHGWEDFASEVPTLLEFCGVSTMR